MKPWCNGYRHWRYSFVFNVNFGQISNIALVRSSPPEVLLGEGVLKIYRKFTGEHLCRKICSWFRRQLTFVSTYFKICFRNKKQLSLWFWKPPHFCVKWLAQKQPPRGVPRKSCSENMQQIYTRTPMPIIEITLRHGCSTVNLLHIFRTPFVKNTSMWMLLLVLIGR